jgi:RHH-type proline utilization regulon transcriptional repressor/proline dehydrogenase/delta 1-pyrroline-5-carboxylate dehydrogenase
MKVTNDLHTPSEAHPSYNAFYRLDESEAVAWLLEQIQESSEQSTHIRMRARVLIEAVRSRKPKNFSIENFLQTYSLSSREGLVLMCLAEALLRVPDSRTKTRLIRDKIGSIDWMEGFRQEGSSLFTNLASLGLATADHLMRWGFDHKGFVATVGSLTRRLSEPVIRQAMAQAMKNLGHQFVMGETIAQALKRSKPSEKAGYRHSYDMLGEEARTKSDAARFYHAYLQAIEAIGQDGKLAEGGDVFARPSISVKLSALHPRYEFANRSRVLEDLVPIVLSLSQLAKEHNMGLTIDAEESERLDLSLEIIDRISGHAATKGWDGFGLAVQAYQKRAPLVIDALIEMARRHGRRLCVRLVKGAYWDSEVKRTQEKGLAGYAVFTRKAYTDVCYQLCAQKMLKAPDAIYAQFATHNAYTIAMILELAGDVPFEFQRLHGMGEALYAQIVDATIPCRVYAPVGEHRDLLAYLVRRLLENGANTSFVNKIQDPAIPIESLTANPIALAQSYVPIAHPKIPLPIDILHPQRRNSRGLDFSDIAVVRDLYEKIEQTEATMPWLSYPVIGGKAIKQGEPITLYNPANTDHRIGQAWQGEVKDAEAAMGIAAQAFEAWSQTPVEVRAQALDKLGDSLECHREELMALLVREAGKTLNDAISEVREAVDFCRYYAEEARRLMGAPMTLPGPTGEVNQLSLQGRGVFVCISPWNFPLAIFLGQVTAALAAGNCVIAKPAQQTSLIAFRAIQLAHQAGIPVNVLHFLPGKGSILGAKLASDPRTAGVVFTGSTEVAQEIARTLVARDKAPLVPLIAETGGMNAMIVDSSALPEQVVQDIIISSFQSAGQRCSALRLLFIQEEIADTALTMLAGAMAELSVGDPKLLSTDVGPVIDGRAQSQLAAYADGLDGKARLIYRVALGEKHQRGNFMAPQAWELSSSQQMTEEVFGPILHVVRFKAKDLDKVIEDINRTGYGLTLGVHSRIDETINDVRKRARVGNLYINRSMIGAVVGVQPFGGEGFSGTGPKAGGPHYLSRFTVERTFTKNTTAAGGNASLLADVE